MLGGGKPLALVPKYLSKAQLADPRSTRTSLDYPLWCAEQDVAAQEPDGDGAVEETEERGARWRCKLLWPPSCGTAEPTRGMRHGRPDLQI